MFEIIREDELTNLKGWDEDCVLHSVMMSGIQWTKVNKNTYIMAGVESLFGEKLKEMYAIVTSKPESLTDAALKRKYKVVDGRPVLISA